MDPSGLPRWIGEALDRAIPKAALKNGTYYAGVCRNAKVARWIAAENVFVHWRKKFGSVFTETISHPEDYARYDVFIPEREIPPPTLAIPVPGDDDGKIVTVAEYDAWIESL